MGTAAAQRPALAWGAALGAAAAAGAAGAAAARFDLWPGYSCAFPGLADGTLQRSDVWAGYHAGVRAERRCAEFCEGTEGCVAFMRRASTSECWLYRARPRPVPGPDFDCARQRPSSAQYRGGDQVLLENWQAAAEGAAGGAALTVDDVAFGFELLVNAAGLEGRLFGVRVSQDPVTLMLLQEHVWELRPDLVVEVGTECGGLASVLAELQRLAGVQDGRVLTVDISPAGYAPWAHEHCEQRRADSTLWRRHLASGRIAAILRESSRWGCPCGSGSGGSGPPCTCAADDGELRAIVAEAAASAATVLVIDDSSHFRDDVIRNFELLGPFVTPGSLYIVADTRLDRLCETVQRLGHPLPNGFNPGEQVKCDYYVDNGPAAAVQELLASSALARARFRADPLAERTVLNSNPGGWLRAS